MTWAVLWAKPKQDRLAAENLAQQGFEVYRPLVKTRTLGRNRKFQSHSAGLFGRYFFFKCEDGNWPVVKNTRGVGGVVTTGWALPEVPPSVINALRNSEVGGFVPVDKPQRFRSNQSVVVREGPMAGYHGLFVKATTSERVKVLFRMLGNFVPAEISERMLEAR